MKSLFPYLVMIALFLAGTQLVNRQQQYARSLQESAPVKSVSFTSMLTENSNEPKPESNTLKLAIDTGTVNVHKPGPDESTNSKKRGHSMVKY